MCNLYRRTALIQKFVRLLSMQTTVHHQIWWGQISWEQKNCHRRHRRPNNLIHSMHNSDSSKMRKGCGDVWKCRSTLYSQASYPSWQDTAPHHSHDYRYTYQSRTQQGVWDSHWSLFNVMGNRREELDDSRSSLLHCMQTLRRQTTTSLVPRLFCAGGEKRAWDTPSVHAPNIQQLFIQTWHAWHKILIITVVT